jgi:asparagine synthetase B (glutamine-hydrolysing)
LSGGLDSRTVLAATTRQITAFTVGESQNREVRTAEAIARTKGCKFVFVKRETDHYVKNLEKAIDLSDGLYMFIHAHFINLLEQISNECDIIIHGCYLDNFKGFGFPPQRTVKNLGKEIGHKRLGMRPSFHADHHLAKLSEEKLAQAILEDTRFANQTLLHSPRRIFTPLYSEQVTVHMNQAIRNLVKEAYERGANLSDVWDYIITWHVLSKQRTYLHLSHIRAFMPERTMIFDNDLFDLYLEMPAEFKRDGKVYRKALKKLNPKIAVIPDANTGFNPQISKKLYPILSFLIAKKRILVSKKKQELLTNQSQGSWPDITEMLRQDSNLKILLEEAIKNPRCLDPTIFDIESIIQLLRDHTERRADHTMLLYLLLTFGRWHRKFGPKAAAYDQDSKKLTRYDEDENWNEKISKLQNDINRLTQELDGLQQEVKKRDLIITQLHNSLNNSLSLRLARRIPFGARIRKLLVPE